MAVLPTGIGPVTGGYQIERSLRFNSADTAYVSRTFGTPTSNKKWTYSVWMKRSAFAANQAIISSNVDGAQYWDMRFNASDQIYIQNRVGSSNLLVANTTAVYRDPSAWYHIVFVFDSDNATAANRNLLYVNNVNYTLSANSGSGNASAWNVNSVQHNIGVSRTLTTGGGIWSEFNGYQTEINFIDGQALTPSDFGETDSDTGVWKPRAYSGTYGTNGFYLKFADNSGTTSTTLGKDSSSNGNNWTPNNFSVTAGAGNDSLVDSPTAYGTDTGVGGSVRGNYCTLNPINKGAGVVLTNGSLDYTNNATYRAVVGTIAVSTGKYYWEVNVSTNSWDIGVCEAASKVIDQSTSPSLCLFGYSCFNGNKYIGASKTASSYDTSGGISGATVLGFAVDFTTGTATIYRDNVSKGVIHTWTPGVDYVPYIGYDTTPSGIASFNFGQRAFAYTAPSGFKALVTTNLPTPTIGATSTTQANDYFNTVLYTGNGSTQSITGVGFQPDWVWLKSRSNATDNELTDAVRGATKSLISNSTAAEATDTNGLTAFNSDGFSLGTDANYNGSTRTYVAWNWNAGGSNATNTSGTITSTVRANTTSGFSIVTYTGDGGTNRTVGHGLGRTPAMIILKDRDVNSSTGHWFVAHKNLTAGNMIYLSLTNAEGAISGTNGGVSITNDLVFTLTSAGTNANTVESGDRYVAYCFAEIAGFSKFGSYTGNGSTDGPFVYTGFRPAYVLIKYSSGTADWIVLDENRPGYNVIGGNLYPNASSAEDTQTKLDILSNGFKIRADSSNANVNVTSGTYIYAAFAEFPFKYALAR